MLLTKDYQNVANYTWNVTSNQKVIFYLDAKIGDYDISNNRTPIYTRLRSTINITPAGGSGYKFTCTYAPTVEGSAVWYFGNETITETNTTEYVYHNDDGTADIILTASVYNGYLGLNKSFSGNATLPTIPRKSSINVLTAEIESSTIITINRASSSFTHTLRYSFGSLSGTIVEKTNQTSISWLLPTTFYSQIPNSFYGTGTMYCDTYNGNTLIGTSSITFWVNTNITLCKPEVTINAIDINENTLALTNDETSVVKGYSKIQCTWSSTAKNSASIKSNKINGISVSESPYFIYSANNNKFVLEATDSRDYSNSATSNLSLIDYIPLQISPNFYREAPTTGEVMLEFTGNYFNNKFGENGVNNELHIGYKYRGKGSETSWDDIAENEISSDLYTINNNVINSNAPISLGTIYDYEKNYEFILLFKDKIVDTYVSKIVPKGKPIFWWDENGIYDGKTNGKFAALDLVYPVGSIYMSVSDTSPQTLFGGTWERINGRFLLGTGTPSDNTDNYFGSLNGTYSAGVSSKGGQAYHTLTSSESGQKNLGRIWTSTSDLSHYHDISTGGYSYAPGSAPNAFSIATSNSTQAKDTSASTATNTTSLSNNHYIDIGGQDASSAHNNMPPYFAVNMWKRTA